MLHRVHGDGDMGLPAGENEHGFNIIPGVDLAVITGSGRARATGLLNHILGVQDAILVDIAHGDKLHIGHGHQRAKLLYAAVAQPNDTGPNCSSDTTKFHFCSLRQVVALLR